MAVTYELSRQHNNYPNMTVYDRFADGVPAGWQVYANEGYVIYDTTANDVQINPDTMEEIPVTYYYTAVGLSKYHNWNTFPYVAVLRDSVDENYIFGGVDNDHEVM